MPKISPFLWFDGNAEEAAEFYVSVFPNSRITRIMRTPEGGMGPVGSVLTIAFELDGFEVTAINGGPHFTFDEAVSFVVPTRDQAETDHYYAKLLEGGGVESQCGWLKDRFGFSWQVTPTILIDYLCSDDRAKASRVIQAMMQMQKIDIAKLEEAAAASS